MNFKLSNPTRIYFGEGSISNLKSEIEGKENILLVYGKESIKKYGLYDEVIQILKENNKNVFELSGIKSNPDISSVIEGSKICKEDNIDLILGIGGGSVIDCSKLISVAAKYDGDFWQVVKNKKFDLKESIPLGVILTNSATSSENNYFAVISNDETKEKLGTAFWYAAFPSFSILDPKNTLSLPKSVTIDSIIDICSHILENYFHDKDVENPIIKINDITMEGMLKELINLGPKLINNLDDIKLREAVMFIATQGLSTRIRHIVGGNWSCHSIEHALSAVYDIPHGGGLAVITPHWMDYCVETSTAKFKQMAVNVFDIKEEGKNDLEIAKEGITAFREFLNKMEAPTTLNYYNIDERDMEELIEKSMGGSEKIGGFNPLNTEGVRKILLSSM